MTARKPISLGIASAFIEIRLRRCMNEACRFDIRFFMTELCVGKNTGVSASCVYYYSVNIGCECIRAFAEGKVWICTFVHSEETLKLCLTHRLLDSFSHDFEILYISRIFVRFNVSYQIISFVYLKVHISFIGKIELFHYFGPRLFFSINPKIKKADLRDEIGKP